MRCQRLWRDTTTAALLGMVMLWLPGAHAAAAGQDGPATGQDNPPAAAKEKPPHE